MASKKKIIYFTTACRAFHA